METAFCAIGLRDGFVPGAAHLKNVDPACADLNLPLATVNEKVEYVLNNSSGFGGANVCLVLKRSS
jgi:3-oxoacyl-[acyl-carrier-protein] synthase-1